MKFSELEPGQYFLPVDEDGVYMKVYGHNLQAMLSEGVGGHAVNMDKGLVCFFHDHELVNLLEVDLKITDCF